MAAGGADVTDWPQGGKEYWGFTLDMIRLVWERLVLAWI
jgi:hypothetical protein